MIANKKTFNVGLIMMVAFIVVLVIFFMPVYNGHNGLNYLDSLYNSISKGSAYTSPNSRRRCSLSTEKRWMSIDGPAVPEDRCDGRGQRRKFEGLRRYGTDSFRLPGGQRCHVL